MLLLSQCVFFFPVQSCLCFQTTLKSQSAEPMGEGESMASSSSILALSIRFLHPEAAPFLRREEKWLLYPEEEQSGVWMIKAYSLGT